jgi:arylsulfatase A-like enzyme
MKKQLNRREFLKMAGLFSLSLSIPQPLSTPILSTPGDTVKNILIVVFDALSAYNMSLYGYPRKTMPNLDRLARRAVVYNNHFAGGTYTTPGTASLLTGTLPWTHRAFNLNETTEKSFVQKNIFHILPNHYRMAYTHNPLADTFLRQFQKDIPGYFPLEKLYLIGNRFLNFFFLNDPDTAHLAWSRMMKKKEEGHAYSLFLSFLYDKYIKYKTERIQADFPRGLPFIHVDNYYKLEDAIDWLENRITNIQQPFLGYFHFLPPHRPYNTRKDFYRKFAKDNYRPKKKPEHIFTMHKTQYYLNIQRNQYDEYILYVDEEFNRLYEYMDKLGLLENTWLIFTSDHGEMFERGIFQHGTPALHQPVVRIPLVIFEPGRTTREDIYAPTSAIDVLPTLTHWFNQPIPAWCEGSVLPPYSPIKPNPNRDLFTVEPKYNGKYSPFELASVMLVKDQYKLSYYYGYKELKGIGDLIELYDIQNDPEEMINLYPSKKDIGDELLNIVKAKLVEVNAPYA